MQDAYKAKQDALWKRMRTALDAIGKAKCCELTVDELMDVVRMRWPNLSGGFTDIKEREVQQLEKIVKRIK